MTTNHIEEPLKDSTYAAIEKRLNDLGFKYKFGTPLDGVFFEEKTSIAIVLRIDANAYEGTIYHTMMDLGYKKETIQLPIREEERPQPRNVIDRTLTERESKMMRMLDKLIASYKNLAEAETTNIESKKRYEDSKEAFEISKTMIQQLHNLDDKMPGSIIESYLINLKQK